MNVFRVARFRPGLKFAFLGFLMVVFATSCGCAFLLASKARCASMKRAAESHHDAAEYWEGMLEASGDSSLFHDDLDDSYFFRDKRIKDIVEAVERDIDDLKNVIRFHRDMESKFRLAAKELWAEAPPAHECPVDEKGLFLRLTGVEEPFSARPGQRFIPPVKSKGAKKGDRAKKGNITNIE